MAEPKVVPKKTRKSKDAEGVSTPKKADTPTVHPVESLEDADVVQTPVKAVKKISKTPRSSGKDSKPTRVAAEEEPAQATEHKTPKSTERKRKHKELDQPEAASSKTGPSPMRAAPANVADDSDDDDDAPAEISFKVSKQQVTDRAAQAQSAIDQYVHWDHVFAALML